MNMKEQKISKILDIISSLRESDYYIPYIFMQGGCYKFHLFLKTIYPDAVPYIHQDKDHVVTCLYGKLFDMRGQINPVFEMMYSPLKDEDLAVVESWSFSRTQVLQLRECPFCGEPVLFREENVKIFSESGFYILGSNDAEHFILLSGTEKISDIRDLITKMNKTKAYKYFMLCLVGGVRTDVAINYIEIIADETYTNRLR